MFRLAALAVLLTLSPTAAAFASPYQPGDPCWEDWDDDECELGYDIAPPQPEGEEQHLDTMSDDFRDWDDVPVLPPEPEPEPAPTAEPEPEPAAEPTEESVARTVSDPEVDEPEPATATRVLCHAAQAPLARCV